MKFHCFNKLIKMRKTLQIDCHEVSWGCCFFWGDLIGVDVAYRSPKLHTFPSIQQDVAILTLCCDIVKHLY